METVQRLHASGWGFWDGQTLDGTEAIHISCPACRREERRRRRNQATIDDQIIPGLE